MKTPNTEYNCFVFKEKAQDPKEKQVFVSFNFIQFQLANLKRV